MRSSLPLFGVQLKFVPHSLTHVEQQSTNKQGDDTQDRKNEHQGEMANCTAFHENMN
jgi:hypothetical protein